ncbi:MAG: T9SS type A sorting domain-containing protein [Candidatus Competibacteraceae bacterium]|nr:T9SS type A sorting domain-containing protein [Candidatus Competibacteraceae bacterium]
MKKLLFTHLLITGVGIAAIAQPVRYLDDIFTKSQVVRTTNVVFGENYYFLNFPPAPAGTSSSTPKDTVLLMDVYTPPVSDTENDRPVVIYLHTGSFLPKFINGQTTGNNKDSSVVEICTRFAQKGYVVAALNYRLGWNPLAPTQIERTRQILNAVYRLINDAKTSVRFFKKDAATSNTYRIDPKKIFMIGQGSGGYASLAYAFLDKYSETELPKFLDGLGNSVIDTSLVGGILGNGGAFNIYNHPGYTNDVAMVANIGGAMGDISWMDQEWPRVPVASLHCRKDIFAPFDSGNVVVPTTQQVVVFVHGSRTVLAKAVSQGLNDVWVNHTFTDGISTRAYAMNAKVTHEGLFQIERPDCPTLGAQEGAPWEWWDSTAVVAEAALIGQNGTAIHSSSLTTNPDMSKAKAIAYIDTIVGFLAPRMYLVIQDPTIGLENQEEAEFVIYPNPTTDQITISLKGNATIHSVELLDLSGRVLMRRDQIGADKFVTYTYGLPTGTYLLRIYSTLGTATEKIIIK